MRLQDLMQAGQANYRRFVDWLGSKKVRGRIQDFLEAHPFLESVPYWVAATLVGLVAVWYAEGFKYCNKTMHEFLVSNPYIAFLLAPVCFLGAWWLVERFAPAAAGSGIPAVMAAINLDVKSPRRYLERFTSLKISLVKIVSSLLCVLGGGAIGREGPTIQIATSIFLFIGNGFRKVWPKTSHHPWLIAGGAAGLAAAFNTPLGGIVFAIEELAAQHFNRFKTVLISAVIVSGMVAQWIWGPYLFFGYPELRSVTASFIPWAILIGVLCGMGGGFFSKLLLMGLRRMQIQSLKRRALYASGAGLFLISYAFYVNDQVLGGGSDVVRELLFGENSNGDPTRASWSLVIGRYVGTMLTYLTGAAGGIFAPSLAIGATFGSKLAFLVGTVHANLMVLAGMAAFLAAVTRAPFTAMVLVIEMTDRHSAIFQLMVAVLVAYVVARSIDARSFYSHRRDEFIEGIRALEASKSGSNAPKPEPKSP